MLDNGKRDSKCSALPLLALDGEPSAVTLGDEVVTEREAPASTSGLGGEERLENFGLNALTHACTVVRYVHHYLLADLLSSYFHGGQVVGFSYFLALLHGVEGGSWHLVWRPPRCNGICGYSANRCCWWSQSKMSWSTADTWERWR
jgi:hypothetical protein